MAKHSGILSNFSGKIGPVVGVNRNGVGYLRSKPRRKAGTRASDLQLARRARFALGTRMLNAMGQLVNISYQKGYGKTRKNAAQSRLLSQAIGGEYPDLYIDYPAIEIARGDLKKAEHPAVTLTADQQLRFTWTDNTGMGTASSTDQAILVAYCPETNDLIWTGNGGLRSDEEGLLDARLLMKAIGGRGYGVHTWISFRESRKERVADGVYVGFVEIPMNTNQKGDI